MLNEQAHLYINLVKQPVYVAVLSKADRKVGAKEMLQNLADITKTIADVSNQANVWNVYLFLLSATLVSMAPSYTRRRSWNLLQ